MVQDVIRYPRKAEQNTGLQTPVRTHLAKSLKSFRPVLSRVAGLPPHLFCSHPSNVRVQVLPPESRDIELSAIPAIVSGNLNTAATVAPPTYPKGGEVHALSNVSPSSRRNVFLEERSFGSTATVIE
ncbi:hypothetical protein NITLEN_90001 [Nitrospira lenta]|uniref:Uncharacterized protein n=1 Tax=Nitrospira lenta TaxID=1436998 RepID=A0A330LCN8_9BACT|nr:hypothetical protein NITLEN_90001 [Nitrospira lenta]